MKKKLILPAVLILWAVSAGLAHATHIHFENYREGDITFDATNSDSSDVIYQSYTWTFDLNENSMDLWVIPPDMVQNQAYDFVANPAGYAESTGNMAPEDVLHYAYLTMRFYNVKDADAPETITLDLLGLGDETLELDNPTAISEGGLTPNTALVEALLAIDPSLEHDQGSGASLDVTSYLRESHLLDVTITAVSGSFVVDFMDLSGCYEETAPVPEPATMLLFGTGLTGLASFARRKSKKG